jgi:hypothetical protein
MNKAEAERIAESVVADLFQNGSGQAAQRLVLTVDTPTPKNLGGWARGPAKDRIVAILTGGTEKP